MAMTPMAAAADLVMCYFNARNAAHIMHLQSRSYAQHQALSGFYYGVIDKIDAFVEAFQGVYGIITKYPPQSAQEQARNWGDGVPLMKEVRDCAKETRAVIPETQLYR